jgi:hypothetical protein
LAPGAAALLGLLSPSDGAQAGSARVCESKSTPASMSTCYAKSNLNLRAAHGRLLLTGQQVGCRLRFSDALTVASRSRELRSDTLIGRPPQPASARAVQSLERTLTVRQSISTKRVPQPYNISVMPCDGHRNPLDAAAIQQRGSGRTAATPPHLAASFDFSSTKKPRTMPGPLSCEC